MRGMKKKMARFGGPFAFLEPMADLSQIKKWRDAYANQKSNAKRRGIDWRFTFPEWLEWWGEDIHSRGNGVNDLCMQRVGDVGPYAEWNVRKGTPRDNGRTRSKSVTHKRAMLTAAAIRAAEMKAPSIQDHGEDEVSEYADLGYRPCATWLV